MPTPKPYDYITTATGSLTTPPGSPKILIHKRQRKEGSGSEKAPMKAGEE